MQLLTYKILFVALLGFIFASLEREFPEAGPNEPIRITEDIIKSPFDPFSYRRIILPNGLEALLVSDSGANRASAAMNVYVGRLQEPDGLPGLAHFLEHVLFLGTKKYPGHGEFLDFVEKRGGFDNGGTSDEHTQYYFDILSDHLEGALDRFSRFFIDPLFDKDCMERELDAVEKEFQMKRSDWGVEMSLVVKTLCKGHPFGRFGHGNLETLKTIPEQEGISVREEMIKFYETFYSANIMKLAVYGKESLDDLERMVRERFSDIPNRNVEIKNPPGLPINPEYMGRMITIDDSVEGSPLIFRWHLPGAQDCSYQQSLLNKAGPGSLRKSLSKFEWFSSLKATSEADHRGFTIFEVTVYRSSSPSVSVSKTVELIFAYIKSIGAWKEYHDELLSLHEVNFKFNPISKLGSFLVTRTIAKNMHYYEPSKVLWGRQTDEFDPMAIQSVTDQLCLDNVIIITLIPNIAGENLMIEPYTVAKFMIEDLPSELVEKVQSIEADPTFRMPQLNRYLQMPALNVSRASLKLESVRVSCNGIKFWFTKNDSSRPVTTIRLALITHQHTSSIADFIQMRLFIEMFKLECFDTIHEAQEVGLQFRVKFESRGIVFSFGGPKELLFSYLFDVFEKMIDFIPDSNVQFVVAKDLFEVELLVLLDPNPKSRIQMCWELLSETSFWPINVLNVLEGYDYSQLAGYSGGTLFSQGELSVSHGGGITKEEASDFRLKLCRIFARMKPYAEHERPNTRFALFPLGQSLIFHNFIKSDDSVTIVYLQTGSSDDPQIRGLTSLLASIIRPSFFNELRTKQQLAYFLSAELEQNHRSTGIKFTIQSDLSPKKLDDKIEEYINKHILKCVADMSEGDFDHHKQAFSNKLDNQAVNSFDLWVSFELDNEALLYVERATKGDLDDFIRKHILPNAPMRRKVSFHIQGSGARDQLSDEYSELPESVKVFSDPDEFKRVLEYFPSPDVVAQCV